MHKKNWKFKIIIPDAELIVRWDITPYEIRKFNKSFGINIKRRI